MSKNKLFTDSNTFGRTPTRAFFASLFCIGLTACAAPYGMPAAPDAAISALYQQAIASPVRTDDDRQSDASRKPLEFLKFAGVVPGMQVLDVSAGGGTTTRLLALVVGDGGKVYAQGATPRAAIEKRLATHPQAAIVPTVRPFDDPVPPGIAPLDLITINMSYHDIANLPIDRQLLDRRLFQALKPGGRLIVIDHAARAGSGTADIKTLHRIDEAVVREDFRLAGFTLEGASDFLRNGADARDKTSAEMERMSDKFALRFIKPRP